MVRRFVGVIAIVLAAALAQAQDPATKTAPAVKAQAPAEKALAEARKIADPDKKIEALRQVIKDYPKSDEAESANYAILQALTARVKDGGKAVLEHMKGLIEAEPEPSRPQVYANMASNLVSQNLLPAEAESFARTALEGMTEDSWASVKKAQFEKMAAQRKERDPKAVIDLPDASMLHSMFVSERQSNLVVLAQAQLRQGKLVDAEKAFRDAYQLDKKGYGASTAALRLAEFAKLSGREAEQFEFLTHVALNGRLTADSRRDLETAYRKAHGGSLDGLEEMLDARYEAENPRPVHGEPYKKTPGRSDRVVLAEMFTGAGCSPCVGADLAFEAALERYSPSELAVLIYHEHVPKPDPLTNPSGVARQNFYGMRGVPSFYIDGVGDGKGGGPADMAGKIYRERIEPVIDRRLATKAEAKLGLTAKATGSRIGATVTLGPKMAGTKLRLHLALVESRVRYSGENGIRFHPMVVRALASAEKDHLGFPLEPGKPAKIECSFDLDQVVADARNHLDEFEKTYDTPGGFSFLTKKHEIDRGGLSVVAFVQDEETKNVLQAAVVKVGK